MQRYVYGRSTLNIYDTKWKYESVIGRWRRKVHKLYNVKTFAKPENPQTSSKMYAMNFVN